ncbi:MAG: hypothetical protein IVW54_02435 [Candidatus Binataceae bacterium]|nr:hypothetical protein [Candidatus Binataceae bacterium]
MLRRIDKGWLIAFRRVILDQVVLPSPGCFNLFFESGRGNEERLRPHELYNPQTSRGRE